MKKLSLLITLFFVAGALFAQSQRLVMIEEFTQASCPPCASQNPAFNTLLNANPTKVVELKYQTDWPGVDPMNAQNPGEVTTRVGYYAVTGVPHGTYDGVAFTGASYVGAPANATQATINTEYAVPASFDMTLSHSFNAAYDSVNITCSISCTQAATGTFVLHVALMERNIYFTSAPGTNGETHFEGVMKKMIPNASGTPLSNTWTLGQTQTLNFSIALPWYVYNLNETGVVAFIQNNANKAIAQAAYSAPIGGIPTTNNAAITSSSNLPFLNCSGIYNPSVIIKNMSATTLTSATLNYSVDGVSIGSQPWTGSLAQGATATVALPTITVVGSGNHSLTFKVADPNGSVDYAPIDNNYSKTVDLPSSVVAPVAEPFAVVSYPPSGWGVEDVNNDGFTWARNTAGFSGAGSSKMDFYNSPSGRVDNLVTPSIDFTGANSMATLEFDVAHAQYGTENDRLQVNISTDCGATWTNPYNKAGATLATTTATTGVFVPTTSSQWRHEIVSLSSFAGQSNLIIQFKATSAFGNNLYIDNVNVLPGTVGVPSIANESNVVSVYPNPGNGAFNLKINFDQPQDITVNVTNPIGEVVKTLELKNTSSGTFALDLTGQAKGNYFVNISTGKETITRRITITQ